MIETTNAGGADVTDNDNGNVQHDLGKLTGRVGIAETKVETLKEAHKESQQEFRGAIKELRNEFRSFVRDIHEARESDRKSGKALFVAVLASIVSGLIGLAVQFLKGGGPTGGQ